MKNICTKLSFESWHAKFIRYVNMSEPIKNIDTLDDWKSEFLPRLQKSYIYNFINRKL